MLDPSHRCVDLIKIDERWKEGWRWSDGEEGWIWRDGEEGWGGGMVRRDGEEGWGGGMEVDERWK